MDPIIVFVPTGEVRPPQKGESFTNGDTLELADMDFSAMSFPIAQRHEIEVPEGADQFTWYLSKYGGTLRHEAIPLPRPRKKVKKVGWMNAYRTSSGSRIYDTEQEAWDTRDKLADHRCILKVEYEVEEEI